MKSLGSRQVLTVALLFVGYAAYYFCRSDLSVSLPLLIDELSKHGISRDTATIRFGSIASFGVLAYAIGKFLLGSLGDVWGGRRSFLGGMAGAVLFTLLFALSGSLPLFTLAWIGNRLTQSMGWAGAMKICSKWFSYESYGLIVGIVSLSFLVGDASARELMGVLIAHGASWRTVFYFAAAVCAGALMANLLLLRESRTELGFSEPEVNPLNVYRSKGASGKASFLKPLLSSGAFWMVCFLSLGTTIVRETFNTWTPTYLHKFFGYSDAAAASISAVFPALGAVSVLVAGWAGDRLGPAGRYLTFCVGMVVTAAGLLAMRLTPSGTTPGVLPLVLIGSVGFGLLGPYSYLAGALALDFGGKEGGATSSGIIDGVGYLGGVLAGDSVARLAVSFGWQEVFAVLAYLSGASALAAGVLFVRQRGRLVT